MIPLHPPHGPLDPASRLDPSLPWDRVKLSVVIPAYNEERTIEALLARVAEVPLDVEVIVVDDGSSDGTRPLLARLREEGLIQTLLFHEKNRGKGAALRSGFERVSGDVVVVQDADLEYDPRELPALLEPILSGKADAVYGSRLLGGPHRVLLFWHSVGNRFLTLLSNMLTDLNLTDMETCYKMIRADLLRSLPLSADRFGFEPEVTAKLAQAGARIYELPISYHGRSYAEGKKIGWKDGVAAIGYILRANLLGPRPRKWRPSGDVGAGIRPPERGGPRADESGDPPARQGAAKGSADAMGG